MARPAILFVAVAVVAVVVGIYFGAQRVPSASGPGSAVQVQALADFQFTDLNGLSVRLKERHGKIVIANFWATWCAPCVEEIPGLISVQKAFAANGVLIVGIAIDSADKVKPFAERMKIDYPLLLGGGGAIDLLRDLGNQKGLLPYTVIIDRDGAIRDRHLGLISESALSAKLRGLSGGG